MATTHMTTPVKIHSTTVIVPDKTICVTCRDRNPSRLLLFQKTGEKAAAYHAYHAYFGTKLADVEANWYSYLCRPCERMLKRLVVIKKEVEDTETFIRDNCQQLLPHCQQKRGLRSPQTPRNTPTQGQLAGSNRVKKSSKKLCFELSSDGDSGLAANSSTLTQSLNNTLGLDCNNEIIYQTPQDLCYERSEGDSGITSLLEDSALETMDEPLCSTPTKTQRSILELSQIEPNNSSILQTSTLAKESMAESVSRSNRRETICYKTSKLMKKQAPIVHALSQGSILKALKLIHQSHPEAVGKLFNTIVLNEVKQFHKLENSQALRANSPSELLSFSMERVRDEVKLHAPTLWSVLCTASKKKKGTLQLQRVTTASLLLLNSRSNQLNAMQYVTGILAYQHCMQKEGIEFLSHIGLSVSHSSLLRKLNAAQSINENKMLQWKAALERQNQATSSVQNDHDYCAPVIVTDPSTEELDQPDGNPPDLHPAFCLVLDNFDVEIKTRNMTMDNRDKSLHYVQVMAVLDRVNVEALPLIDPEPVRLTQLDNACFMPSPDDVCSMREDFIHLPLGIFNKSENVLHELTEVMERLHKLVPGSRIDTELEQEDMISRDLSCALMRPIPIGGDQLTVERIRGVHESTKEYDTPDERLEGLFAMMEDFHEKMNYLELIVHKFYKKDSVLEGGTLFQLKTVVNRTNMTTAVRQNYHDVSGFIDLVTECHVMAAAMHFLQMDTAESRPGVFPEDIENQTPIEKAAFLRELVSKIVDRYIYHKLGNDMNRLQENTNTDAHGQQDHVFNHASTLMTHGLIRKVTLMTTAAGDGDRAVRNWKYALLAFNTTNKTKYRLEAFLLIASVTCLLPPRLREQLKWGRFVNVSGGPLKNVDGDMAMEMLNNDARKQVKNLGPNHTPEVVERIGKTVKFTSETARNLGRQAGVAPTSRDHTSPSLVKDRAKILKQLTDTSNVFAFTPGRQHETFQEQPSTIYGGVNARKLHGWMSEKKKQYGRAKWAF